MQQINEISLFLTHTPIRFVEYVKSFHEPV